MKIHKSWTKKFYNIGPWCQVVNLTPGDDEMIEATNDYNASFKMLHHYASWGQIYKTFLSVIYEYS
jgi:hypothetical protein